MLAKAKDTLKLYSNIEYAVVDIQHIPYANRSFDLIIANMMLYHVPDIPRALLEVRRVLREGGTFCCATYGENGIMEYLAGLFQEYGVSEKANYTFTLQNGRQQLQAYFDTVERYDYRRFTGSDRRCELTLRITFFADRHVVVACPSQETIIKALNAASVHALF